MSAFDDLGFEPASLEPAALVSHLNDRVRAILRDIESSDVWVAVMSSESPLEFVVDVLREIYLEIFMYQEESIEGAVAAISQFPRSMPVVWFGEMLQHQVEEFDHGEMALRDYVALGGNETMARARRQAPSAFAVAAVWKHIAHKRDPFLYLGAVYLFEALTPIITARVKEDLRQRLGSFNGLEFIAHHATADIEHERVIGELIAEIIARYPEAKASVVYGFEYFAHVYPLPGWRAAVDRVRRSTSQVSLAAE